ncbi:MAG: 6-phospho-beta-glucosidase [Epulopiscium sp. Nuni2H_MBin001]|nr:MAG: 6-phospho-beta-glucosidase [Epulopiscium sp. Nuni2H_MBin001]
MLKVVVIGGGSSYTPELVEGFIKRHKYLPVEELWLVDCEAGQSKLEIVGELAKRMVEESGVPMSVHLTLDRTHALGGASFVVTQLRVGLLEARVKDERIPLKYGMYGQETNGAGGMFKALRTVPVILGICKDMEQLCPDAWLINFTNPAGIVTEAVRRYSNIKRVVGLCNVPYDMHTAIARILEKDKEQVRIYVGGLNHMSYVTRVEVDGEDVTGYVLDRWGSHSMNNIENKEWINGFVKELGVLPSPYHRYYYMAKEILEEAMVSEQTRAEKVMALEEELFELYGDVNLRTKPKQLEKRGGAYYSDAACSLICSIYNDTGDIQVVNTANCGVMNEFEYDEVVEISAVITKAGPVPVAVGKLPKSVRGLVNTIKSFEVAVCEAAVSGSYEKALLALMINPLVGSQREAVKVLDEMLEAHGEYLELFSK